jgi:hypothetical protein
MSEVYQPSLKDTYLHSNNPTTNYGSEEGLIVYTNTGGTIFLRSILTFDLTAQIIPSTDIASAKLYVYYNTYPTGDDPVGQTLRAYKVRRTDWEETEATWNVYKSGSNWSTAGAGDTTNDIDNTLTGTGTVPAGFGWVEIDITDIVVDAIDNVSKIVHLILKWDNEAIGATYDFRFHSTQYTGESSLKPKIVIEYTPNTASVSDTVTMTEIVKEDITMTKTETITIDDESVVLKPLAVKNQTINDAVIKNQYKT